MQSFRSFYLQSTFALLLVTTALSATKSGPHQQWIFSGVPLLMGTWLLGDVVGSRVLPFFSLWTLISTLNLVYLIASTSWLFYYIFSGVCNVLVFYTCVFQFELVASIVRRILRYCISNMHFINDKIALFRLPALEIDVETEGLLIVKGCSINLATFTFIAHGVELLVKLPNRMKLFVRTNQIQVSLLREISVTDVFCNVQSVDSGESGVLGTEKMQIYDQSLQRDDASIPANSPSNSQSVPSHPLECERNPTAVGDQANKGYLRTVINIIKEANAADERASHAYENELKVIQESSVLGKDSSIFTSSAKAISTGKDLTNTSFKLHEYTTLSEAPTKTIKVTTLQKLIPQALKRFLQRLPMILRLLLSPMAYFHPVKIRSLTVTTSGSLAEHAFNNSTFEVDTSDYGTDTVLVIERITSWLREASQALCLRDITTSASVPLSPDLPTLSNWEVRDICAFRGLSDDSEAEQIIEFSGGQALLAIPSFLLPYHEHMIPPAPVAAAEQPELTIPTQNHTPQPKDSGHRDRDTSNDEESSSLKLSVYGNLPIRFNQEFLDFAAAFGKAAKMVQVEEDHMESINKQGTIKEISASIRSNLRGSLEKLSVRGRANDRVVATLAGNIFSKLETMKGSVGYSGFISLPLDKYRPKTPQATKLLP